MFHSTQFPLTVLVGEEQEQTWKCVTAHNDDTPEKLGFKKDFDLKMAIGEEGDDDVMVYATHWTLRNANQHIADQHHIQEALGPTQQVTIEVDIDDSRMPSDRLTYAVVVALEELADNGRYDANTRSFAWMYAKHTRATDMTFKHLLHTPAIAHMAAKALDAWVVRHPIFRAQAHEAQDRLSNALDKYKPTRPTYEPYWILNGNEGRDVTREVTRDVTREVTREGTESLERSPFERGQSDSTTLEG
jgi:hypothetical protein